MTDLIARLSAATGPDRELDPACRADDSLPGSDEAWQAGISAWRQVRREVRKFIPVSHGCEHCWEENEHTEHVTKGVRLESSRTAYPFVGTPGSRGDPNRPVALCRRHAREHHAHWDEMWRDYYGGRL